MTPLKTFRVIAPEFAAVANETVKAWINLTIPLVSKEKFGELYSQAVALLTAHRMKLAGIGAADGAAGIGGSSLAVGDTMRIASYSEGDTSVSFFAGSSSGGSTDAELNLTSYGTQFTSLREMVIMPIVCSGEKQ